MTNPLQSTTSFGGTAMQPGGFSRTSSAHNMTTDAMRAIDQNHATFNDNLDAYLKQNQSWVSKIFPNQRDKLMKDYELQKARSDCEFTLRLLHLGYETKYQACHEESEAWLQTLKVEIRMRVAGFLAQKEGELREQIHQHRLQLENVIRERFIQIGRNADIPVLQDKLRLSMEKEILDTVDWLDSLLASFRQIHIERLVVQPQGR